MRRIVMLLAAAACAASLAACSGNSNGWDSASAEYAAYATQMPLYPKSKITDAMGSESWGDGPDSYSYGMAWWCEVKATKAEILAFYAGKYPSAERRNTDGGAIELKVIPAGAKPGEYMGVWIDEDGKYRIFESRKSKKIERS
jgi:hypothetical protein